METGIELIKKERQRQIESEGWDVAHDDAHSESELYRAAMAYYYQATNSSHGWPWSKEWWKPKGLLKDRVRSGALIQAEIDRLERLKMQMATEIDNYLRNSINP